MEKHNSVKRLGSGLGSRVEGFAPGAEAVAGAYLRRKDSCTTRLKAQGPSRTFNESREEVEGFAPGAEAAAARTGCESPRRYV